MIYFGKYDILGIKVTACDYDYVLKRIFESLKEKRKLVVAPIATHPVVLAQSNKEYQKVLNNFNLVVPDSQYLRWSINFLYNINLLDRVYGPDLFLKILRVSEIKKYKIFLVGNNLEKLIIKLREKFPKLKKSYFFDLNYKKLNSELNRKILDKFKKVKPDMVIIGIGSPNQHYLANSFKNCNIVILCVGAAFDFISGVKKQAPKWMQRWGLEWLFRCFIEPKRLCCRYLQSLTFFSHIFLKKLNFKIYKE